MGAAARSFDGRAHALPARRVVATRRHGVVDVAPRAMVRATVGIQASPRPALALVPRRRRAARLMVVMATMVGLAMLGAAAFQTQLAQRQLELDRLDRDIASSREQYDVLRRERSELRSPGRLAEVAAAHGMVPARDSRFEEIGADVLTAVQQSTGSLDPSMLSEESSLLEQFRDVKAATDGTP